LARSPFGSTPMGAGLFIFIGIAKMGRNRIARIVPGEQCRRANIHNQDQMTFGTFVFYFGIFPMWKFAAFIKWQTASFQE
jgi:hypothetical protein